MGHERGVLYAVACREFCYFNYIIRSVARSRMTLPANRTPLERCIRKLFRFIDNHLLDLGKERLFLFRWMFPKRFKRYIRKLTYALTNQLDHFLAYGDSIPYFQPTDDIYSCSSEQARPTPEQLEELAQGRLNGTQLPILQGSITRDGFYEYRGDIIDAMGSALMELKPKLPLMDRKYPHACHNPKCKNPLQYKHALNEGYMKEDLRKHSYNIYSKEFKVQEAKKLYAFEKQFKRMWKSSYFKFFCCDCFKDITIQTYYFEDVNKSNEIPI